MMKKTVKPLLSLSLAAALVFGVTACNNAAPNPSPSASASASATISSPPSPTPSADIATPPASADTGTELQEAKKAFPNLKVKNGENENDVLLAVYGASRYINTVYNSGYLANGSWAKNGADGTELYKIFGKDWSDSYRAKIDGIINDYKSDDSSTHNQAARLLMNHMFYLDSAQGPSVKVPDDCSKNNIGAASCLVGEKISLDKEITYQVNKDTGSIYVNATFTDNVRIINNEVDGVSAVHYDIQLEMIKNPYPDAQNLRFAYVVNDIGGSWKVDSWHKGE